MRDEAHGPGWDTKALNRIAREAYGGLAQMFAAHGWATDGKSVSQIARTRVIETYGSIRAFVRTHEAGHKAAKA